jgi:transcriptional regulator with XRE-family HTH domain
MPKFVALTPEQIRAARALLRWRAEDLAERSSLGIATINRAELAVGRTSLTVANDQTVRRTLEEGGVEFLAQTESEGPGVRLRKPRKA